MCVVQTNVNRLLSHVGLTSELLQSLPLCSLPLQFLLLFELELLDVLFLLIREL